MRGQDTGEGVNSLEIGDADRELLDFAKKASKGTPLTSVLKRFDNHRDYIQTTKKYGCERDDTLLTPTDFKNSDYIYRELVAVNTLLNWLDQEEKYVTWA
jgi:hypothetical protein